MTRILAYLTAAIGLLAMAGCGEVKKGGINVAQPPKPATPPPLARAPKDLATKPTPLPPKAAGPGAAPASADPAINDHIEIAKAVLSKASGDQYHYELEYSFDRGRPNPSHFYIVFFGDRHGQKEKFTPIKAFRGSEIAERGKLEGSLSWDGGHSSPHVGIMEATSNTSVAQAASDWILATSGGDGALPDAAAGPGEIKLSGLSVVRVDEYYVRFSVDYAFSKGKPDPSEKYHFELSRPPSDEARGRRLHGEKVFSGAELARSGHVEEKVVVNGDSKVYAAGVYVNDSGGNPRKGMFISNIISAAPGAGPPHEQNGASPPGG